MHIATIIIIYVHGQFLIGAQPQLKNELNVVNSKEVFKCIRTMYIFKIVFLMVRIYVRRYKKCKFMGSDF